MRRSGDIKILLKLKVLEDLVLILGGILGEDLLHT